MRGVKRAFAWAAVPLLAAVLVGCSIVDDFSGRAVDFNLQAEQVQEQTMLLNIVRASMRRPMQFTGLQSITGNASMSLGSTLSAPFGEPAHRPRGTASPDVFGASGTISGGPTFIVPVLDTQEFYEGILNPISLQIFDYYLQQGIPPEVLFDLFVSKIVITQRTDTGCTETTFSNSVSDDVEFDQFQAIVDLLFAAGLSTEHVETTSRVGAPIPQASLDPSKGGDADNAAKLIQAYASATTAGLKITKGTGGQSDAYQLEKTGVSYRFCFRDPGLQFRGLLNALDLVLICGETRATANEDKPPRQAACRPGSTNGSPAARAAQSADAESQVAPGTVSAGGTAGFNLNLAAPALKAVDDRLTGAAKSNTEGSVYAQHVTVEKLIPGAISFDIQLRSTEGILYYLGEVTRRHLYPESSVDTKPRLIQVPTRVPAGAMPISACNGQEHPTRKTDLIYFDGTPATNQYYYCENIFVVDKGLSGAFVSVSYDGNSFGLSQGDDRTGRTYQVLELAKQILAVNTSAKQLPATSVVVISQP
jgi:hypothetical protein